MTSQSDAQLTAYLAACDPHVVALDRLPSSGIELRMLFHHTAWNGRRP